MTEYRDPDTFEEAPGPQSWRFDRTHLVRLVDLLLAAKPASHVEILEAYYQRIITGGWPDADARDINGPYHPGAYWMAPLVPEIRGWSSHKGRLSGETKAKMRAIVQKRQAIELDLMRQIMEAYFQAKAQARADIPHRDPGQPERRAKRIAERFRTRAIDTTTVAT